MTGSDEWWIVGGRGVRPLECAILRKSRAEEGCRERGSPWGLLSGVLANYIQVALLNTVKSSKVESPEIF